MKSSLGEKLYTLRKQNGLSQEELAEKLNVSRQTISNWENDKVKIDAVCATEICKIFSISMDDLFLDADEIQSKGKPEQKRKPQNKIIAVIILILSVTLVIIGAVMLTISKDNNVSSTIFITEKAGLILLICMGIIISFISVILIIKNLKK